MNSYRNLSPTRHTGFASGTDYILPRFKNLLSFAAVAACVGAFSPILTAQLFTETTSQVGLQNAAKKSWGNPIWGDMNNDGYLDLIVPTHGLAVSHGPFVYLNHAGTTFSDYLVASQIKKAPDLDTRDWHGFSFGDYDGDGNLDLYIAEGAKAKFGGTEKRDLLFKGHGDGTFELTSEAAGMVTSTDRGRCGYWIDYNNDGKLDLFVKNYGDTNRLYKNNGDGTFTEGAAAAGIADATLGTNLGSLCSFADYDNDRFMDVFFSGDQTTDVLYRNRGDGTFVDVTAAAGVESLSNGHGVAWGDYDNDGNQDMFVPREASLAGIGGTLYHNNGDGTFSDATIAAGVSSIANSYSAVWGDYDNDGFLDLLVTSAGVDAVGTNNNNMLFHNNGDGTFTDVAAQEGLALTDNVSLHKGAAWADYDNDGFLDILIKDGVGNERDNGTGSSGVHRLFRNSGNSNHFIKVNLQGTVSNKQGIGARLAVTYDGKTSYRQNNGGGGGEYASQGSEPLHVGIGAAETADVTVTWPSGSVNTVLAVAANSAITVVEAATAPAPPRITKQPANKTVVEGKAAKFSVGAEGDPPLTYQWQRNGTELPGATDFIYGTPPTTRADNDSVFSVVVTNSAGSVTSREARLTVTPKSP